MFESTFTHSLTHTHTLKTSSKQNKCVNNKWTFVTYYEQKKTAM